MALYCPQGFECDPTYSKGYFYRSTVPKPLYAFDLVPQQRGVVCADAKHLPLPASCVSSLILDPPFLPNKSGTKGIMRTRFSGLGDISCFNGNMAALYSEYSQMLYEAYRVLRDAGILVFKCQDYTSFDFYPTHIKVYDFAIEAGFQAVDLFILLSKNRPIRTDLHQRHARKFHSYLWVFQK